MAFQNAILICLTVFLFALLQVQARESKFFSKFTHNNKVKVSSVSFPPIESPSLAPEPTSTDIERAQEPGYGLFGGGSSMFVPSKESLDREVRSSMNENDVENALLMERENGSFESGSQEGKYYKNEYINAQNNNGYESTIENNNGYMTTTNNDKNVDDNSINGYANDENVYAANNAYDTYFNDKNFYGEDNKDYTNDKNGYFSDKNVYEANKAYDSYFNANDGYPNANKGYANANNGYANANTSTNTNNNNGYPNANNGYANANNDYTNVNSGYANNNNGYANVNANNDNANANNGYANANNGYANNNNGYANVNDNNDNANANNGYANDNNGYNTNLYSENYKNGEFDMENKGMSDTRDLENSKYFHDLKKEKNDPNEYLNGREWSSSGINTHNSNEFNTMGDYNQEIYEP